MSNLTRLGDIYEELLNLGFIKPMIVRHYNDEYILVHIFSDTDVDVCKIVKTTNEDTFAILVTNFQKDSVDCFEGDPVAFITDKFIESNGLDKLDVKALADVIDRTCNNMEIVKTADGVYTIPCKSFRIYIKVKDDMFEIKLYNTDYNSPVYSFKTGFEAFKFIYYIKRYRINHFSYNKVTYPLLTLALDLYLKFSDDVINTLPTNNIEDTVVELQSNSGYMAFYIDTLDGENLINCKIIRPGEFHGNFKAKKYEDILDFVDREYEVIK